MASYFIDDFLVTPQVPPSFKKNPVEYTVYAASFRDSFFAITLPLLAGLGIFYVGWALIQDDSRWLAWAFGAIFFVVGLQRVILIKSKVTVNRDSLRFDYVWRSKIVTFGEFEGAELHYVHHQFIGEESRDTLTVELTIILNEEKTNVDLSSYPNASRQILAVIRYFHPNKTYHMEWVDNRLRSRTILNLQDGSFS